MHTDWETGHRRVTDRSGSGCRADRAPARFNHVAAGAHSQAGDLVGRSN